MKNFYIILACVLLIIGCTNQSNKPDFDEESSGFLVHYDLLQPVSGPVGMQIYAYKDDDVDADDYVAAIVEPVFIYEGATDNEGKVSQENIENAKRGINNGLRQAVGEHFELTRIPGPGVFRMQVAITGATLEEEGFKPWNIIPVSAAIRLSTYAAGYENKQPVLMVELKITDSETGEIIKEILTINSGEYFRNEENTSAAFEDLAKEWVKFVVDYSGMFTLED